jgi:hypothetical protein
MFITPTMAKSFSTRNFAKGQIATNMPMDDLCPAGIDLHTNEQAEPPRPDARPVLLLREIFILEPFSVHTE